MHAHGQLPELTCRGKKQNKTTTALTLTPTGKRDSPTYLSCMESHADVAQHEKYTLAYPPCSCHGRCWCSGSHCFTFNLIYSFIHSLTHPLWVIVILRMQSMQSCALSLYAAAAAAMSVHTRKKDPYLTQSPIHKISVIMQFKHQNETEKKLQLKFNNRKPGACIWIICKKKKIFFFWRSRSTHYPSTLYRECSRRHLSIPVYHNAFLKYFII